MWHTCCFLFILFLFSTPLLSQSGDAINNQYDSVHQLVEQSVSAYQDSLEREKLLQNIKKNGKPLDVILAERKEQERKEAQRQWIRIGAGAIFLGVLIFTSARHYQKRKRH